MHPKDVYREIAQLLGFDPVRATPQQVLEVFLYVMRSAKSSDDPRDEDLGIEDETGESVGYARTRGRKAVF